MVRSDRQRSVSQPGIGRAYENKGVACHILSGKVASSVAFSLADIAISTKEEFAKIWAYTRAAHLVGAGIQIQSAMKHSAAGALAAARSDLEYVRDHFNLQCSISSSADLAVGRNAKGRVGEGHCDGAGEGIRAAIRRSARFFWGTGGYRKRLPDEKATERRWRCTPHSACGWPRAAPR
jgi:hypothetical protein